MIEEMFAEWLAEVVAIVGDDVDVHDARQAFEVFDKPYKPLTAAEYANMLLHPVRI